MKRYVVTLVMGLMISPMAAFAQDDQTLADIRQEMTILYVELQKLRRELSTTGNTQIENLPASVLERVAAMESELQRMTSKTEELEGRINRIVADGTNRIGDLEFRLVELEGGDVSTLGETSTLGGGEVPASGAGLTDPVEPSDGPDLAVGERTDFDRAKEVLASGDFRTAATLFETFSQTYPGGPLAPEAQLRLGEAFKGLGDTRAAARAFLDAFSADPTGPLAPNALYELGAALGGLEQKTEACLTLGEVALRFPESPFVARAESQKQSLACP